MFQPVEKSRAFERVVEQIQEAIFKGELRPGDHLPSERALVEEFQVGRSTVREALRILESMGLLQTQPGSPRGPRVSPSNTLGLRRMLEGVVRVEQISLVDLIQYRIVAGSTANYLAAHLRSKDHLTRISKALDEMATADPDDDATFAQCDVRFHEAVADAAGNAFLNLIGTVINEVIVDLVADTIRSAADAERVRKEFIDLHRQIFDAIERHDGEEAGRLARTSLYDVYGGHLSESERARLKLLI